MTKPDIRDFTRQELAGTLISLGKKGSIADRVFNCLYRKGAESFDAMAGVQEELKSTLAAAYTVSPAPSIEKRVSKIDNTIKLLFTFPDGAKAESVVLFNKKNRYQDGKDVASDIREQISELLTGADTCFPLGVGCGVCTGKPLIGELTAEVLIYAEEKLRQQLVGWIKGLKALTEASN